MRVVYHFKKPLSMVFANQIEVMDGQPSSTIVLLLQNKKNGAKPVPFCLLKISMLKNLPYASMEGFIVFAI